VRGGGGESGGWRSANLQRVGDDGGGEESVEVMVEEVRMEEMVEEVRMKDDGRGGQGGVRGGGNQVRGEAVRVEEGRKVRTCEEEARSVAVSWRQRRAGSRACGIKANARDRRARAGSACMRAGSACGRGISVKARDQCAAGSGRWSRWRGERGGDGGGGEDGGDGRGGEDGRDGRGGQGEEVRMEEIQEEESGWRR
jgi:hypothetical protein